MVEVAMTTDDVAFDDWEPVVTLVGTKWVPTIGGKNRSCATCPVRAECAADVARGDFAWCERVIDADYRLGVEQEEEEEKCWL